MKKVALALAAVMIAGMAMAQTNFSGTWKLNASKSQQSEMSFGPTSMVITQADNSLTIESVSSMMGQEMKSTSKYTLDGKETTNSMDGGMMEMQRKSTAVWNEGKTVLTITTKMDMMGMGEMATTETYKLNDGNLEVTFAMSMPEMPDMPAMGGGGINEKRVYDKQ